MRKDYERTGETRTEASLRLVGATLLVIKLLGHWTLLGSFSVALIYTPTSEFT
jgi:hypothetical protein